VELGPLVGLAGSCGGQNMAMKYNRYGGADVLSRVLERQGGDDSDERSDESIGTDPEQLKFKCYVTAMFQLGK
jgi:hypothetical protein